MNIKGAAASGPPLSRCRRAGNLLFVSGQVPRDETGAMVQGGIKAQTRQALENLISVLEGEGCTLADVVKVTAWITDENLLAEFNEAYRSILSPPFPARSVVVSRLAVAADVEIEAIALIQ